MSQNPKLKSIFATMGKSFPLALHSLNSLHNTVSESGLYPHLSCPQVICYFIFIIFIFFFNLFLLLLLFINEFGFFA